MVLIIKYTYFSTTTGYLKRLTLPSSPPVARANLFQDLQTVLMSE